MADQSPKGNVLSASEQEEAATSRSEAPRSDAAQSWLAHDWFAMTPSSAGWTTNRFLASMDVHGMARWLPHLRVLNLPAGYVLVKAHEKPHYVYFPTTSIVSLVHVEENGSTVEVAVTGREGFVGVPVVTGGDVMPYQVCNRQHSLDQHLCRWLLLMFDRLEDQQLSMTQETISTMLGVRRETVTEAAGALQAAGLIRYARGRIDLMDRRGLEARACECHAIVAQEYRRLLR